MMDFTFYDKNGRCIDSVSIKPHFFRQMINFGICNFMYSETITIRDEGDEYLEKACKLTADIRDGILDVLGVFLTALVATAIGELKAASMSVKPQQTRHYRGVQAKTSHRAVRPSTYRLDAPIFQDGFDSRPMNLSIDQMYKFFVWQVETCLTIAKYIADDRVTHFDMD